jgi:hypothetical protein
VDIDGAERCELTELLATDCAHCRRVADPFTALPIEYGQWFMARYHGNCTRCGEPIKPGDPIRADSYPGYIGECCE